MKDYLDKSANDSHECCAHATNQSPILFDCGDNFFLNHGHFGIEKSDVFIRNFRVVEKNRKLFIGFLVDVFLEFVHVI